MEGKKKRKNYFSNHGNDHKRRKRLSLEIGMRGFLCTCNFREKDCVREAYNLLEEYADKISVLDDEQVGIISFMRIKTFPMLIKIFLSLIS